jgi:transcriptional regulator with XRE-family HTH domain
MLQRCEEAALSEPGLSKGEFRYFGKLVRKARLKANLTQKKLSRLSGVKSVDLQRVEVAHGEPPSEWMAASIVHSLPASSELETFLRLYQRPIEQSPGVMDRLPDLLRIGREEVGISRRQLARRAGLDAMYVSRLERGLVRVADWRKISAIAAQIPLSELAKLTRVSGAGMLKHSAIALASDLERLLASLPPSTFEDEEWVAALQTRLLKCEIGIKGPKDTNPWGHIQNANLRELWKSTGRKGNPSCPQTFVTR